MATAEVFGFTRRSAYVGSKYIGQLLETQATGYAWSIYVDSFIFNILPLLYNN